MNKSISILLLNIHSDRNAGDYALSRVSVSQLQSVFPNCKITLSMNDPDSYTGDLQVVNSPFVWVKRGNKWLWTRIIQFIVGTFIPILLFRILKVSATVLTPKQIRTWFSALINADIIVSTAGGYQYSSGKGITFLIINYILLLSLLGKKPLYFLPQSFGPYNYWWEKIITKIVCNSSQIVMAREPVSFENLKSCGVDEKRITLLPDLAFGFIGETLSKADEWLNNLGLDTTNDRPFLGMTIIDWQAFYPSFTRQDEYECAIISLIEYFITMINGKVIILPQTWGPTEAEDDRVISQKIGKKLQHLKSNLFIITEPIYPELLHTILGSMDVVVGTRMHSNIFAMTHGTPSLPIGYLHKSIGIAQMLGMEKWVIDINEISREILLEKFEELWENRNYVRLQLKDKIDKVINESQRASKLIAMNYYNFFIKKS